MKHSKRNTNSKIIFKLNKIFVNNSNAYIRRSIIAIIAVVECLILLAFTTFSWIESSSSIVIEGHNLNVASQLNYNVNYETGGNIDLSGYFSNTAYFKYAKASSYNGKDFFFPKRNNLNTSDTTYREGDTTDFNTSYRSFDFIFTRSETRSGVYYYAFNTTDIFSFPDLDSSIADEAKKLFRISIQMNDDTPVIFANNTSTYSAVSGKNGTTSSVTPNKISDIMTAFAVSASTTNKVTVRVWYENNAPTKLTTSQKDLVLQSEILVNLGFKKLATEPTYDSFIHFRDYTKTYNTTSVTFNYKQNSTSRTMSLQYDSNSSTSEYNAYISSTTVSIKNITSDSFEQSGKPTYYTSSNPKSGSGTIVYSALGSTKYNGSYTYGFGEWTDDVSTVYFDGKYLTYYSTDSFNKQTTSFITNPIDISKNLYVNLSGNQPTQESTKTTQTLKYDSTSNRWSALLPTSYLSDTNTLYFYNTNTNDFRMSTGNASIFVARYPNPDNNEYVFKPLGYTNSTNTEGVGTWTSVDIIKLSSELIDFKLSSADRFKIKVKLDGTYCNYYMQPYADNLTYKAYAPVDCGKSDNDLIDFSYIPGSGDTKLTETLVRGNHDKAYMVISKSDGAYHTYWNIAVVVDGTAENLLNPSVIPNQTLTYTQSESNESKSLVQIDNTRWYAPLLNDTSSVSYVWAPYPLTSTNFNIFNHNLSDGIYYTITEGY